MISTACHNDEKKSLVLDLFMITALRILESYTEVILSQSIKNILERFRQAHARPHVFAPLPPASPHPHIPPFLDSEHNASPTRRFPTTQLHNKPSRLFPRQPPEPWQAKRTPARTAKRQRATHARPTPRPRSKQPRTATPKPQRRRSGPRAPRTRARSSHLPHLLFLLSYPES